MIKLDKRMYDGIKDKYIETITECIKNKYNDPKNEILDKKYFNRIQVKDLVETNGKFDDEKIKQLLLLDFSEINDVNIKNYMDIAYLCYSDFKVSKLLKERKIKNTVENKKKYRKDFVKKHSNTWLDVFDIKDEDYKNEKNFTCFINKVKKEFDGFNEEIKKVISYSLIRSDLRHEILVSSNISICPYCNRQYISYYKKNENKEKTTADLDHFYSQSIFQLFSLSLYNFIPACQICNRNFKRTNIKKILYPFEKGFDDEVKFDIDVHDIEAFYGLSNHFDIDIEIEENASNKDEILNSIDVFNLESIYQNHKPYVQEILRKKELIYTDTYLEMMNDTFTCLNFSREQIDTFLYGFNIDDDISKDTKPLGKLTRDILKK